MLILANQNLQGSSQIPGIVCNEVLTSRLTGNTNDWGPPGFNSANQWEIDVTTAVNLTGIQGGFPGRVITLLCTGAGSLSLVGESGLSAAANRIVTALIGSTITLGSGAVIQLLYSKLSTRWQVALSGV